MGKSSSVDLRERVESHQAIGDICDIDDPQECWNDLKKAGYASD